MRVRALLIASALTGAATAALATGTSAAATPFVIPQAGAVGVELSPGETQSLANSPIPALVDRYAPHSALAVDVEPNSTLPQDDQYVFAGIQDVVGEAADHPGGSVDLIADSEGVVVAQVW